MQYNVITNLFSSDIVSGTRLEHILLSQVFQPTYIGWFHKGKHIMRLAFIFPVEFMIYIKERLTENNDNPKICKNIWYL